MDSLLDQQALGKMFGDSTQQVGIVIDQLSEGTTRNNVDLAVEDGFKAAFALRYV